MSIYCRANLNYVQGLGLVPDMTPDEIVLFRSYDSQRVEQALPFWAPHTAFLDPVAGPDAPPRESFEMRAICLFAA